MHGQQNIKFCDAIVLSLNISPICCRL